MSVVHVALLPLAMALSWGLAASAAAGTHSTTGLIILLGGVLLIYGGDRLIDPGPVLASRWRRQLWQRLLVQIGTGAGALLLLTALIADPWPASASLLSAAMLLALLPVAKRLPGAKELLVGCCWALLCGSLPTGLAPWALLAAAPAWFTLQALLFTSATALCELKDRERDLAQGRRSLASIADGHGAIRLAMALSLAVAAATWQLPHHGMLACALAVLLLSQFPRLLQRPLLGPMLVDASLCLIAIDSVIN